MAVLTVTERNTGEARVARRAGLVPAILYGRKEKPTPIAIPLRDFEKAFHEAGESSVIELHGLGEVKNVLIHEVSWDAVSGAPLHADLYAIEKGQKVSVAVPLIFEGVSPAVKDLGGILVKVMHELEVEGEPKYLPHTIVVDVSGLAALDDQIHVRDISLPSGVITDVEADEVVAMISVAKEEPIEEVPVDISNIETSVERGKKEEVEESDTPAEK